MKRHSGFTIMEILVTLAIAAILARLAMPNYASFMNRQAVDSEATSFALDLRFARSEAARLNATMLVCAAADGVTCGTDWTAKRIVFRDADSSGVVDGTESVARTSDTPLPAVTIRGTGFPTAGQLHIRPTGQPEAAVSLTFCVASQPGMTGRQLVLSAAGKPLLSNFTCP